MAGSVRAAGLGAGRRAIGTPAAPIRPPPAAPGTASPARTSDAAIPVAAPDDRLDRPRPRPGAPPPSTADRLPVAACPRPADAAVRSDALGLARRRRRERSTTASTSRRSVATASSPPTTASSWRPAGTTTSSWAGSATSRRTSRRLEQEDLWATLPIVVVIDDGNGYRSIYAHFGKIIVKKGRRVKAGKLIGYEGATGRASGCHLHYGLFSPLERARFEIDAGVAKRMKLPPLRDRPDRPAARPAGADEGPKPTPTPDPARSRRPRPRPKRWAEHATPRVSEARRPAVAAGDEPVRRDRGQRLRHRRDPSVAALEREQRVGRWRVGRPGVHLGEVDRHAAGLGGARGDAISASGRAPASYSARISSLGAPRRLAQQDRPPAVGDGRRHGPVARYGDRLDDRLATRPARRLVEQRVLVEVGVRAEAVGRRAVAEDRPDRRRRRPRRGRGRWRGPSGGSRPAGT